MCEGSRESPLAGACFSNSAAKNSGGCASASGNTGGEYRDGGGRHARDPRGLSDGARAALGPLFDNLARKTRNGAVIEALGDAPGLERLQSLDALFFAPDVAFVADTALENALL